MFGKMFLCVVMCDVVCVFGYEYVIGDCLVKLIFDF